MFYYIIFYDISLVTGMKVFLNITKKIWFTI